MMEYVRRYYAGLPVHGSHSMLIPKALRPYALILGGLLAPASDSHTHTHTHYHIHIHLPAAREPASPLWPVRMCHSGYTSGNTIKQAL